MSGGLAKQGMLPVVAIYSTFFQRCYDQLMQDVSMLNLPVIFCIDRAGLVGEDGETHHGIYDLGILKQIPNMRVLCPGSCMELRAMLSDVAENPTGPVAIRYPRGGNGQFTASCWEGEDHELVHLTRKGERVVLITYGTMLSSAMDAAEILHKENIEVTVLRILQVLPMPVSQLLQHIGDTDRVYILEEAADGAAICQDLAWEINQSKPCCKVQGIHLRKEFLPHGKQDALYAFCGLNGESVARRIREDLEIED